MAEEKQEISLVGQEISGCEILQKVAVGGMGAVYKARHKALDRVVCVKILSPSLTNDKKAVELFLTEARAIAELEHPNIVQVFNVGKEKGYYFIVMSFIEGQTLSQLLKKSKGLPLDIILDLFEGILLGLDAAHAKGIIHRDIKPSNILINAEGQPKIVDFGIAKKTDKEKGVTKSTELAGTAYFIAPEQALGRDLDTRADLYSVGASLYYVLTGQFPYNGKNTIEIIQKHISSPIPNPATLRPDIPAWLAGAVQKLMSKKPENRFQTAKETYVYFQKMRAQDRLNFKKGSSINLGENSSLKIVREEKFQSSIQEQRKEEKPAKISATNSSLLPSIDAAIVLPTASAASLSSAADPQIPLDMKPERPTQPKPQPQSQPSLLSVKDVKKINSYTATPSFAERQIRDKARRVVHFTRDVAIKLPLCLLLTIGVAFICFKLGVACSANIVPGAGVLENLINPFLVDKYAPNQLFLAMWAVVAVILIQLSTAVKELARSSLTLLLLALVSYMAGLFAPGQSFASISTVVTSLFTPGYYLCYLVCAFIWAVALCFTYNRTLMQGLLGAALVGLVIVLAFLSSYVSIPPAAYIPSFKIIFFVSLFSGVVSVYYLVNREERTTVVMPLVFLIIAGIGMWVYMLSGMADAIRDTAMTVVSSVHLKPAQTALRNAEIEKEVGIDSRRGIFAQLDKVNSVVPLSSEEQRDYFSRHLQGIAPVISGSDFAPLFVELMRSYFTGGESKMNFCLWRYTLTYPIQVFNRNSQQNGAYGFLMMMLILTSIGLCAISLLFDEE